MRGLLAAVVVSVGRQVMPPAVRVALVASGSHRTSRARRFPGVAAAAAAALAVGLAMVAAAMALAVMALAIMGPLTVVAVLEVLAETRPAVQAAAASLS